MILVGGLFALLLNILQFLPFIGLLVAIFGAGFFGSYYLDVIGTTMNGDDRLPDWPSITDFWADIVGPLFHLIGLVLISFAPALAVVFFISEDMPWFDLALIGTLAWGALYGSSHK